VTDGEFHEALDKIELAHGGEQVLTRSVEAFHQAASVWQGDRSAGRVSTTAVCAAQRAAMQLSLITDGVLFLLGRAPEGATFGVLSHTLA
jgi:hypothetical protein